MKSPEKIVLGLGGTVDYEIELDPVVVNGLIAEYAIRPEEISNSEPINSQRDVLLNLLEFLRTGTGGERFVSQSKFIEEFSSRFRKEITLGGTCVRAAMAMEAFNVASTLHLVSINEDTRRLLPKSSKYICSDDKDTFDPHLIVQFPEGLHINSGDIDFVTLQPNRIIFTNDPPNRDLVISQDLGKVLAKARIFLISGFNCIQDQEVLDERISAIKHHMKAMPDDAIVYFEDAGYHIPALSKRVRDELIDVIDIYSMNEEELQSYLGRTLDLLNVAEMKVALSEIHKLIPANVLVVHTKYWSVAVGKDSAKYIAALQGGITMASTRYLFGEALSQEKYAEVSRLPLNVDGALFATEITKSGTEVIQCVPAFQLSTEKPSTIGLGDTFVGGFITALAN
jgi:ADP-dependent phosphofructokinase/glucokinase